jgi:hypothetical protein
MTYGEAATQTIKGLAASPALLLIAVLNVFMLGGLIYVGRSQVEERKAITTQGNDMVKMLLEKCGGGHQP